MMINPLTGTLKPQNNGHKYSDWFTGRFVTFATARRDLAVASQPIDEGGQRPGAPRC